MRSVKCTCSPTIMAVSRERIMHLQELHHKSCTGTRADMVTGSVCRTVIEIQLGYSQHSYRMENIHGTRPSQHKYMLFLDGSLCRHPIRADDTALG
jgi:hypothetical protein